MKSAPSVVYPAGRSLLPPLAWPLLVPLSLWLWQPWQVRDLQALEGLGAMAMQLLLIGVAVSVSRARPAAVQALHWDGAGWQVERAGGQMTPVQLQVHGDGGRFLWLSLRETRGLSQEHLRPAPTGWLLLRARANPVRWHGFRCAVYCRSQAAALQPQSEVGDA